jgi:hypothetical protein
MLARAPRRVGRKLDCRHGGGSSDETNGKGAEDGGEHVELGVKESGYRNECGGRW